MTDAMPSLSWIPLACSACFHDVGLRLDSARLGVVTALPCPNCGATGEPQLDGPRLQHLAHRFFVQGSLHRTDFGGAPTIEFNAMRLTEIDLAKPLRSDAALISRLAGVGFFYYGPPLWRLGHIEPLEALQEEAQRGAVIQRILSAYPVFQLRPEQALYRLRRGVDRPLDTGQYDSPPAAYCGSGRLDAPDLPVLYGSADLELCLHECRVTAEDQLHVATLAPDRPLHLLDLTALLREEVTAFESLDIAIHLLFLAGAHAYPITRAIATAAQTAGFDGILFPSYFSLLHTGAPFLETVYGLSTRTFENAADYEANKIAANIAIFGYPVADGRLAVERIVVRSVLVGCPMTLVITVLAPVLQPEALIRSELENIVGHGAPPGYWPHIMR